MNVYIVANSDTLQILKVYSDESKAIMYAEEFTELDVFGPFEVE